MTSDAYSNSLWHPLCEGARNCIETLHRHLSDYTLRVTDIDGHNYMIEYNRKQNGLATEAQRIAKEHGIMMRLRWHTYVDTVVDKDCDGTRSGEAVNGQLAVKQVAALTGLSLNALSMLRKRKQGPEYHLVKRAGCGYNVAVYDEESVKKWIAEHPAIVKASTKHIRKPRTA